jgi:hypothetical protein
VGKPSYSVPFNAALLLVLALSLKDRVAWLVPYVSSVMVVLSGVELCLLALKPAEPTLGDKFGPEDAEFRLRSTLVHAAGELTWSPASNHG